jgi:hypothetical protein
MLTAVVATAVEEARWEAMARFMDISSFLGKDSIPQLYPTICTNFVLTVQTQLTVSVSIQNIPLQ